MPFYVCSWLTSQQCTVGGLAKIDCEFRFQVGEGFDVAGGDAFGDLVFTSGVDQRHATSLEPGAAEPASVDSRRLAHQFVNPLEFV